MTWHAIKDDEVELVLQTVLWIETARTFGGRMYKDWVPSHSDIVKSALFERIRSGKQPLPHPPPIGLACPYYGLVEDVGPHWAGCDSMSPQFYDPKNVMTTEGFVYVLQNNYKIIETKSDIDFIVQDANHNTPVESPYRFRLFYDEDWQANGSRERGAWFMQNMDFVK